MDDERSLVLPRQRQLKWKALDWLEVVLMVLCGATLAGFCTSVILDIVTRELLPHFLGYVEQAVGDEGIENFRRVCGWDRPLVV